MHSTRHILSRQKYAFLMKKIIQNIKVRIEIQLLVNYLSINLSPRTIARETKQNKTENYVSNSR